MAFMDLEKLFQFPEFLPLMTKNLHKIFFLKIFSLRLVKKTFEYKNYARV